MTQLARSGFFGLSVVETRQPPSLIPKCGACKLYLHCKSPKMKVSGKGRRKVLIVGEGPGQNEDDQGEPFVGLAGEQLRTTLDKLGVDLRKDCWITNAVICRPTKVEKGKTRNRAPTDKEISYCRPNVLKAVRELDPEMILLLGASAVKSYIGAIWKEDPGGISKWVGWKIPSQRPNAWVCPAWHPSYLLRFEKDGEKRVAQKVWEEHLAQAFNFTARPWKKLPDYQNRVRILYSPKEAAQEIPKFTGERPVAFDFETEGLKPDNPELQIVSCALSNGENTIAFPWHGPAVKAMKVWLASNTPKIGYNCFSGSTRFLTREYGQVRFDKVVGQTVTVLNHEGRWVPGKVRCFGEQDTVETTFVRRNFKVKVRCTWDHRWLLSETYQSISTRGLGRNQSGRKAHAVPYLTAPKKVTDREDYLQGIRHGVVYGDGAKRKDRKGFFVVRLCGEKTELLRYFDGFTRSYPPSYGGDCVVYVTRQTVELKELPPNDSSDSYLIGFFRGLLATDGSVSNGQVSLTNNKKAITWCRRRLPKVGYLFQNWFDWKYGGGCFDGVTYESNQETQCLYLSRESVTEKDLLRSSHKRKYKKVSLGSYKFSSHGETRKEKVYCVTVPDGESFTLDNGLVTGNCKFEQRWAMAKGMEVRNWVWDGMLAAHVLDNRGDVTGLKTQAYLLLGQESYSDSVKPYMKSENSNSKNRIREIPLRTLLMYNGMDALLEWEVAKIQSRQLGIGLFGG